MEPNREDKRKKKKKKKRQAMLAKAIPVVIAMVLIIAIVVLFYGETLIEKVYYSAERRDLYQYFELVESDDVAIIMQDAHVEEKAKYIDGNCYFDMDVVSRYFTNRFYVNIEEGIVTYTTDKEIYKTNIGAVSTLSEPPSTGLPAIHAPLSSEISFMPQPIGLAKYRL